MTPSAGRVAARQTRHDAAILEDLRRLMPGMAGLRQTLPFGRPFGIAALDSHLPGGGLARGALHEIVPATQGAIAAAFGFGAAILAGLFSPPHSGQRKAANRLSRTAPFVLVMPAFWPRRYGRLSGHGLRALGLDPSRLILVEAARHRETLWAMEEALRSAAPAAVAGFIERLDLKSSQRLHLAALDAGLPLLLLRPAQNLESSAAATRWRVGTAEAARDRFGLLARPRWHLHLERCRNGRPGEWVLEYDHVAHRFSLAAALADPSLSRRAGEKPAAQARRA
jgi:protein ImuA